MSSSSDATPTDSERYASPQMRTVGRIKDKYLICDPESAYWIDRQGRVSIRRHEGTAAISVGISIFALIGVGALYGGISAGSHASGIFSLFGFIFGAFFGGFFTMLAAGALVGLMAGASFLYQYVSDRRHGAPRTFKIDDATSSAWTLCDLAWQIGRAESWQDKTVDPERKAASIAWAAVERTLDVEQQYADATRALGHPALKDFAEDTLARIEPEQESLRLVESNLRKVLDTARSIDTAREIEKARRAEERELLGRLAGNNRWRRTVTNDVSDLQAERSAGVAAEAEAIAAWLAESDRILRD